MKNVSMKENARLTEDALRKQFVEEYNKLCEKYGFKIQAFPTWLQDDRHAWLTVIKLSVEKMVKPEPKKEEVAKQ